jgi:hypothetical protein
MAPTLAFAAPADATQFARKARPEAAPPVRKTALPESFSLIVVMLIYLLFGAAGFFAAAQLTM